MVTDDEIKYEAQLIAEQFIRSGSAIQARRQRCADRIVSLAKKARETTPQATTSAVGGNNEIKTSDGDSNVSPHG